MRKSPRLYLLILLIWTALIGVTFGPLLYELQRSDHYGWGVFSLVALSTMFICYFWLNGTKDIVYTMYYYLFKRTLIRVPPHNFWNSSFGEKQPYVLLVYCTC